VSKGSKPRPFSVPYTKYVENWEGVFRKKKPEKPKKVEKKRD